MATALQWPASELPHVIGELEDLLYTYQLISLL